MTTDASRNEMPSQEGEVQTDRRNFMKSTVAAGLLSAAGAVSAFSQPAQAAQQAQTAGTALTPPPGMSPHGIPDLRFPMCYKDSVPAAVRVMTEYFAALGQRDLKGMAEALHFPFGTFERSDAIVVQSPDDLMAHAPASMNMTENPERSTDHDGYLKPGCYDVLDGIEIFNSNPVCVNLALNYNRYSAEGNKLLRCQGIYCVTNNDGKWAIQAMSTIFTPAPMLHVTYDDSVTAAKRLRENHDLAYMNDDQEGVWVRTRQVGMSLNVGAGGGSWQRASEGDFKGLQGLQASGVKTRLSARNYTEEMIKAMHIDFPGYRALWPKLGLGNWGFVYGEGRVLHATVDKVHALQGAYRYTTSGEYINDSVEMDIITYKEGRWGFAGMYGYMTTHDRANDVHS